eukprot:TRINITY_DN3343_c0_g1_i2.p1 TRINITY_DN3343_c0_g1~~TRINITY_DN3343_c0_g1_i2.p1  ORF type:complete len:320 (-),score=44.27 TRINITY_DN3343_c0_g1_i2:158-1066(-)
MVVLLYHMLPFTLVPTGVNLCLLWIVFRMFGWWPAAFMVTVYVILGVVPPYYSPSFRKSVKDFYFAMARYQKSIRLITPKTTLPEGPYIFAIHPHGRMFYTPSLLVQTHDIWGKKFLPKGDIFAAGAGGFYAIPMLRNLLYAVGTFPASRGNIVRCLRNKNHLIIVPGGVKEVLLGTGLESDVLYLKERKGIFKIAMEENVGIIPVYCFNENQLFKHESPAVLNFWKSVNRHATVGMPFMQGVWNLPLPYKRDLLTAIGEPEFPHENDTLDDFHGRYILRLQNLFDNHVDRSPQPNHKLIIT